MIYALEGINPLTNPRTKGACEHNAFEHLCLSLFKRRKDLFGMVTGYFDDSGTGANDSVVVVAGYIGSVTQWRKFGREWGSLLSEFGVTVMRRSDLEKFPEENLSVGHPKRELSSLKRHSK